MTPCTFSSFSLGATTNPSGDIMRGASCWRNLINRTVWPEGFVHHEDDNSTSSSGVRPLDSGLECVAKAFIVYLII